MNEDPLPDLVTAYREALWESSEFTHAANDPWLHRSRPWDGRMDFGSGLRMPSDSLIELAWLENWHRLGVASSSLADFLEATADDPTGYSLSPVPIDRHEAYAHVGPGWANLINDLYDEVDEASRQLWPRVAVIKLRRVMGSLEITVAPPNASATFDEILDRFRARACHECELCGQPASHRIHLWGDVPGWSAGFTACDKHCTRADWTAMCAMNRGRSTAQSDKVWARRGRIPGEGVPGGGTFGYRLRTEPPQDVGDLLLPSSTAPGGPTRGDLKSLKLAVDKYELLIRTAWAARGGFAYRLPNRGWVKIVPVGSRLAWLAQLADRGLIRRLAEDPNRPGTAHAVVSDEDWTDGTRGDGGWGATTHVVLNDTGWDLLRRVRDLIVNPAE